MNINVKFNRKYISERIMSVSSIVYELFRKIWQKIDIITLLKILQ